MNSSGSWVMGVAVCFCFKQRLRSELTKHLKGLHYPSSSCCFLYECRCDTHCQSCTFIKSRQGKCAHKISNSVLCGWRTDTAEMEKKGRQSLLLSVQGSFMCTWTSISLNQECIFQCLNGHSSKIFPHQVSTSSPSVQILICSPLKSIDLQQFACSEAMLPIQRGHRRGWKKAWTWLFISSKRTPCSTGSGALCMSPLAASQRRKLVEMYPNIQCSVRMYAV